MSLLAKNRLVSIGGKRTSLMSRRPHRTIGLNFCVGHRSPVLLLVFKRGRLAGPTCTDVIRNRRKPTSQRVVLHLYLAKAGPCARIHRDEVAVTKGWIARSGLLDSSPYAVASNEKKFVAELQCSDRPRHRAPGFYDSSDVFAVGRIRRKKRRYSPRAPPIKRAGLGSARRTRDRRHCSRRW